MIIEKNKNHVISIHYPITKVKKIDQKIKKEVQKTYQDFKTESKKHLQSELNIDYTYFKDENIKSVCLITYKSSYQKKEETVNCITYNLKKKAYVTLGDLVKEEDWERFVNLIKKKNNSINTNQLTRKFQNFSFSEEQFTIFFQKDKEIFKISLNLEEIPLNLKLQKRKNKNYEKIQNVDFIINPTKPVIALTFDDGPTKYTDEILDILQKENVTATFFVLGNKVDFFQETLRKAVNQGNEIGNHSYNHKWLSRLSTEEIKNQIEKTQEKVKNITGIYPKFLRPTYGSINNRIKNATELNIVLWDIDPKDWKNQSPKETVERILQKTDNGKIILLHDNHKRTVEAVKLLIPRLKEKGYQLVTLSDMEEINTINKSFSKTSKNIY